MYNAASDTATATFIINLWMFWAVEKARDLVALSDEEKEPMELKEELVGSEVLEISVHFCWFGDAGSDQLAKVSVYL